MSLAPGFTGYTDDRPSRVGKAAIRVGDRGYPNGEDHVTCRQHMVGKGPCGEVVFLPQSGSVPMMCSHGHMLPWFGSMEVSPL